MTTTLLNDNSLKSLNSKFIPVCCHQPFQTHVTAKKLFPFDFFLQKVKPYWQLLANQTDCTFKIKTFCNLYQFHRVWPQFFSISLIHISVSLPATDQYIVFVFLFLFCICFLCRANLLYFIWLSYTVRGSHQDLTAHLQLLFRTIKDYISLDNVPLD